MASTSRASVSRPRDSSVRDSSPSRFPEATPRSNCSTAWPITSKEAGAKFTFGTNNAGADDLGDWSYPLAMQQALELGWMDKYVPGHAPSKAQKELAAQTEKE